MDLKIYKVTFLETSDEWIFTYRADGVIYQFTNVKGTRIFNLLKNYQFPQTIDMIEQWTKHKKLVKVEAIIEDYSFDNFWLKYNLKVKKEASQKAYEKLNLVDKIQCFVKLPEYDAILQKTGQAKAHMVTWINQKRFNDEYR